MKSLPTTTATTTSLRLPADAASAGLSASSPTVAATTTTTTPLSHHHFPSTTGIASIPNHRGFKWYFFCLLTICLGFCVLFMGSLYFNPSSSSSSLAIRQSPQNIKTRQESLTKTTKTTITTTTTTKENDAAYENKSLTPETESAQQFSKTAVSSLFLSEQAQTFIAQRQSVYAKAGMMSTWRLRGIGHLYTQHQILLAGQFQYHQAMPDGSNAGRHHQWSIQIYNAYDDRQDTDDGSSSARLGDCDVLTIWVRVMGPEIFAGSAVAVAGAQTTSTTTANGCGWQFPFQPTVPGNYTVDAKVLFWNAKYVQFNSQMKCTSTISQQLPKEFLSSATATTNQAPTTYSNDIGFPRYVHYGFKGFKMYTPEMACCEVCSRLESNTNTMPSCRYWASPPFKLTEPGHTNNGCELFFEIQNEEQFEELDKLLPKSHILGDINVTFPEDDPNPSLRKRRNREAEQWHGFPHNATTAYFLGCGWSNWFTLDFPCLSSEHDDAIFFHERTIAIPSDKMDPPPAAENNNPLPLCQLESESLDRSHGRWVREPWPSNSDCTIPKYKESDKSFNILEFDPDRPHCWHRDDLTVIGHHCVEMNCRFIRPSSNWISDLRKDEHEWMGVWRQTSCDYYEYTNQLLQQCIDQRKITEFQVTGRSIAEYINQYLQMRLQGLELYDKEDKKQGIKITLSTLSLLHLSLSTNEELRQHFSEMDDIDPTREEFYWMSGYYLSSERDTYAITDRMVQVTQLAAEVLTPKGYKMLNALDLSAAWTYDTATQFDGMHIIGPPMKMIISKFFHYICQDIVPGSRI